MLKQIPTQVWILIATAILLVGGVAAVWNLSGGAKAPVVNVADDQPVPVLEAVRDRVLPSDAWFKGPADAKVTVIEFGDFQCPACGAAYSPLKAIEKDYEGKSVRFVYRNFPLVKIHQFAQRSAEAAESAGAQGKFFEMHDKLYEGQPKLSDADILGYAKEINGLDYDKFVSDFNSGKYKSRVDRDEADAIAIGASSTPTFVVNNMIINHGQGLENLKRVIESELSK